MIEAVNSVLANASLSRGSAAQVSTAAKANLEAPTLPQAPFISPRIALDARANKAVIQIRDSDTGDVLTQFPSESRIRAIQAEQALQAAQSARQDTLTGAGDLPQQATSEPQQPSAAPVQSFDAGAIATLQAPQGVSTSDIQQATVAFSAGASAGAQPSTSVNVTA